MLLFGGCIVSIVEHGPLFFKGILLHDSIEVAVPEAIGVVICDLVGRADVALGSSLIVAVVFIGKEEVELDLGVIDRICADYFVEVVPFVHYLCVLGHAWRHGFLEEGFEGLD